MDLTICKRLCNECPFSQNAPKGWLGPHSLDDVLKTQQEGKLFSCHLLRKEEMKKENIESGEVRICRGFIASATKSGIIFGHNSETHRALSELQKLVTEEAKESNESVLSSEEFAEHHGPEIPQRNLPKDSFYQRLGYKV
jgi:hypothetical protein